MMRKSTFDPFFTRVLIALFAGGFLYVLYLLKSVIAPFAIAFVLAYLLNPLVAVLSRYIRRGLAILVVFVVILAILVGFFLWAVPVFWTQLKTLWNYLPLAVDWYNETGRIWLAKHSNNSFAPLDGNAIREQAVAYLQTHYQASDIQTVLVKVASSGLSVMNSAGLLVLIPILAFYFLVNWQERLNTWKSAIPKAYYAKTLEIVKDCDTAMRSFVKGQIMVMLLLGLIYAVQLQLIGLELGLIIGMTAGIASFVPYLGFGIGFTMAMMAGLLQFGANWVNLALIGGAFAIGQAIESYVLQPFLLGDKIGLSPLWVMFSVLAGAGLFGFVGMLIALPVSAIINVLFCHAYDAYKASDWYKGSRQYRLF